MKEKNRLITQILLEYHGFDVSKYDDTFLNKTFRKRITQTLCNTTEEYYTLLKGKNKEGEIFFDSLNICYSHFFRNPLTFAVLERIILPELCLKTRYSKQKEIRVWSAACAAGQETYSLAMLLEELKNGDNEKINFRIFATDQSEIIINEAIEGRYSYNDLNNVNLKRVKQWFTKDGDAYTVNKELKKNIVFSVFDLLSDEFSCPPASIFGDFDLVICANLLFYYKPVYQKKILEKTGNSLTTDGFLITGEAERHILTRYNFSEVFPQSAIFNIGN